MVLHLACNPAENKGRRVVTLCQTPLKANGILEFSKFLWPNKFNDLEAKVLQFCTFHLIREKACSGYVSFVAVDQTFHRLLRQSLL